MIQQDQDEHKNPGISCYFCSEYVSNYFEHLFQCKNLERILVEDKPTYIRIGETNKICKFCFGCYNLTEWKNHSKKKACRTSNQSVKISQLHHKSHSENFNQTKENGLMPKSLSANYQMIDEGIDFQEFKQNQVHLHVQNNIAQIQLKVKKLGQLAKAVLSPYFAQWLEKNSSLNYSFLSSILNHAVSDFCFNFFEKKIQIPTLKDLKELNSHINWNQLIKEPADLLKEDFIDLKLSFMEEKKRMRYIKALNKVALKYKGLFKKRIYKQPQFNKRQVQIVKLSTFINLIQSCICSESKQLVHIGIDFYIILLSGQRFLADFEEMKAGIIEMLENQKEQTFYMFKIGKTSKFQTVYLNKQLFSLLKQFKWNEWSKKTRFLIERMNQWFGLRGYTMKDSIMDYASSFQQSINLSSQLAGHSDKSKGVTRRYTKATVLGAIQQMAQSVSIPGLAYRFNFSQANQLQKWFNFQNQSLITYKQPINDWWTNLLKEVYGVNFRRKPKEQIKLSYGVSEELDFNTDKNIFDIQEDQIIPELSNAMELQIMKQRQQIIEKKSQKKEIISEKIIIYGSIYYLIENQFQMADFYHQKVSKDKFVCLNCNEMIVQKNKIHICPYCQAVTHKKCTNLLCQCFQSTIILSSPKIDLMIGVKKLDLKIYLPEKYQRKNTKQELNIRFILACRRLRYTRVAVCSPGLHISFKEGYYNFAKELIIKDFSQYVNGSYMPPIEAKPLYNIEKDAQYGSHFGIFATEDIDSHILIGEYACDLMEKKDIILCKKLDSVMKYTNDSIYLAPRDFCGYVPLINTQIHKAKNNCSSITAIIDKSLRILLYTSKKIKKGDQLYYSYGHSFDFM